MEILELQKKKRGEWDKQLAEERENLRSLRFKVSADQTKNVREIRKVKKNIARILTLINKKSKEVKSSPVK